MPRLLRRRWLWVLVMLLVTAGFACVGNFAAFFEVAAAVHLDGHQRRLRLLPLLLTGFVVSTES